MNIRLFGRMLHKIIVIITIIVVIGAEIVPGVRENTSSLSTRASRSHDFDLTRTAQKERVYHFKKCGGAGCPYTASWLSHINLYKRVAWYLESTKMETASFNIFDKSQLKWQMSDPHNYFVHHMSMFEHLLHKRYGFAIAKNRTKIMSESAYKGECDSSLFRQQKQGNMKSAEYIALIPFYGGLPPEVTSDYSKVKSIGQGNSLVDPSIKVMQCMATICSCLKYFGHVVIGVAREYDQALVIGALSKLDTRIRSRAHVVSFSMPKPSHLPFHLLAWGQQLVKRHNCAMQRKEQIGGILLANEKRAVQDSDVFDICGGNTWLLGGQHRGGPVNAIAFHNFRGIFKPLPRNLTDETPINPSLLYLREGRYGTGGNFSGGGHTAVGKPKHVNVRPFRFVYYSEMDQIVKFDSIETLNVISTASNVSCFFVGRRKEKGRDSAPEDYMGQLTNWRECGSPGYSLTWPRDIHVRATVKKEKNM